MNRILIIDPNPGPRADLEQRFVDRGDDVLHAATEVEARERLAEGRPELLLCAQDTLGGGRQGIAGFCRRLREDHSRDRLAIVVFSRESLSPDTVRAAIEGGADAFVGPDTLPCVESIVDLELGKRRALRHAADAIVRLRDENAGLEKEARESAARLAEDHASHPEVVANEVIASRPDGVLIVGPDGSVLSADVGSRELVGHGIVGQAVGKILPRSRLASLIGASTSDDHARFAFDVGGRRDRAPRRLQATVTAIHGAVGEAPLRVVLLVDLERRATAEHAAQRTVAPVPDEHYQRLLSAARALHSLEAMPRRSEAARRLHGSLVAASHSLHPVLLRGPAGSGRRRTAERLHHARHATGPLLELSCDGLAEASQRAELFGRRTSDGGRLEGLVERAHDGSLLLLEIERLSADLQRELAAVARDPRLRLIATITVSPDAPVAEGSLVEELAEVFAAGRIDLPPLREQREDLPELIAAGMGPGAFDRLSQEALHALAAWAWPGGLPELDSELRRLAAIEGRPIELDDLKPGIPASGAVEALRDVEIAPYATEPAASPVPQPGPGAKSAARVPRPEEWAITDDDPVDLDLYQRKAVLRALALSGGNRTKAAELLGVGKSSLYRKLTKWGLTGDAD